MALPTETVYGLAGDALNPAALARIFEVKQRPYFDPLIVHIADRIWVEKLCTDIPDQARVLMDRFWPGPLTLVLPKSNLVPDLATSGLPNVALRMPSHPVALALLREVGSPLAAPSANLFGALSPTTARHVSDAFSQGIDCILDGGPCSVGVESTVLGFGENGNPFLLRPGGLSKEEIESVLKMKISAAPISDVPQSPGGLSSHYAPRTPLFFFEAGKSPNASARSGLLWFGPEPVPSGFTAVENISATGNLREAAMNLFAALHKLDSMGLERILAQIVPESGLGRAINDRLRRGCAPLGQ